jgi:glycosyltransferase involved in cell wall biosynthesis
LRGWYELPKSYSDFTFCMQEAYMGENEIYLPYAYDPTVHFPEDKEKKYDVCLIGLLYPQRAALIDKLRSDGLSVFYDIGLIMDEYREKYNESRIALSWSSLNDTPARFFEGLAMQLPVVSNRTPDAMHLFREGSDFLGFDTLGEAAAQISRLMNDEVLRNMIAENGCTAVQKHSYDARAQTILETVGLL